MFASMAVVSLTTLAIFTLLQTHTDQLSTTDAPPPFLPEQSPLSSSCSQEQKEEVWRSLPECQPRPSLVPLELPPDPNILAVIPSKVEVERCAGTCQLGTQFQRCESLSSLNISVPVIYEILVKDSSLTRVEEICSQVTVESHTGCRCGCPEVQCGPDQVFHSRSCQCRCMDQGARGQCLVQSTKVWDEDRCSCLCRPEEWKQCSSGFTYDGVYSCQCLPNFTSANTPLIVFLSVLLVVLLVVSLSLYVKLKHVKRKLSEKNYREQESKLFPNASSP